MYQHHLNRLKVMVRSATIGLIYEKSLGQKSTGYHDGKILTLMSTDVDNIALCASMFHETWAQIVEVLIGTTMLAREIGWIFPVPLIIIFCESSRYIGMAFADDIASLLQSKSLSGQEPPRQAERLDRRYSRTPWDDDVYAFFYQDL